MSDSLVSVINAPKFKYSRLFAIGLYTILAEAQPDMIKELFPNAKIIYDRFHVMAIINDELNKLRKLMGVDEKGLPHLLWKNKEDLKDEQKQQLQVIL